MTFQNRSNANHILGNVTDEQMVVYVREGYTVNRTEVTSGTLTPIASIYYDARNDDRITMRSKGALHSILFRESSDDRIIAHWKGFCEAAEREYLARKND